MVMVSGQERSFFTLENSVKIQTDIIPFSLYQVDKLLLFYKKSKL